MVHLMAESTGGETKSVIAICFITSYSTITKEFKILQLSYPFFCSKHLPVGPSHSLCLLQSIPGTTCLVALLSDKELTVANVGDSRGVLCDKNGNAVPLSHDHKPYQLKERKRIKKAGEKTDRRTFLHFQPCWLVKHSAPKAAKGLRYLRCICSHIWQ